MLQYYYCGSNTLEKKVYALSDLDMWKMRLA